MDSPEPHLKDFTFDSKEVNQDAYDFPVPEEKPHIHISSFGCKSISFFGSIVLLVNNVMGPAMVTIPLVFHMGKLNFRYY